MSYEGRVMSSEMTLEVIPELGNTHAGQRGSGYSVVPDWPRTSRHRAGVSVYGSLGRGYWKTMDYWGVCKPVLKPKIPWEDHYPVNGVQSRDQNRTREIRPSGIVGGLVET